MYDKEFDRPLNFKNITYYQDLNNKYERELGNFLRKNTTSPFVYSNDLRHQYVSALYTRNLGANKAKMLGDLNEIFNFSGSGRYDTQVDKLNNQIGRNYGLKYATTSRDRLLWQLLNDWGKNARYVDNQLNK